MRACSVYNGLILCRRHCFTIVAHNWKFWQMYFAWNIVLKLYMCICIVLWMYFLILTPELSVIFLSSCLLYCLFEDFSRDLACIGSGSPFFNCTVYCMSYSYIHSCIHLKEQLRGWNTHEFCLAKCIFIYLFESPWWVSSRRIAIPPLHRFNFSIYLPSWWDCYDFCTLYSKMFDAWLLWWFSCI